MAKWPVDTRKSEKDEHFWFLTYGISGLVLSVVAGVYLITRMPGPFSGLVTLATTYSGADKLLAQGYIGALLVLILGVPALIIGVFLTATAITVITTLVLLIAKLITQGLSRVIGLLLEKLLPEPIKKALAFAAIGALVGAALGVVVSRDKTIPKTVVSASPDEPDVGTRHGPTAV